jgi:uncharacterized heparinase superfamily protein
LQHAIDRIAPAVKFFRHGDGALALFNGSQEGNAHLCDTTLMHSGARGKAMKSMPHSGYERVCQGRSSLVMDTGQPLLSAYSGRMHAGMLSFEYGYGRERVIVNCGTSSTAGKWRKVLRSTLAHSALIVDNRNSCAFDGEGMLSGRPAIRALRQEDETTALIDGTHNGYVPRFGLIHRRCVKLQDGGELLTGEDQLAGRTGVPFATRFHLHPEIEASVTGDNEVRLRSKSGMNWRFKACGVDVSVEESVYAGNGEHPQPTRQIVLTGETAGSLTTIPWELRHETL